MYKENFHAVRSMRQSVARVNGVISRSGSNRYSDNTPMDFKDTVTPVSGPINSCHFSEPGKVAGKVRLTANGGSPWQDTCADRKPGRADTVKPAAVASGAPG